MKAKILAAALASVAAVASAPAHAGALAMSDLNISALFLADGAGQGPSAQNANITVLSENRTGTADSNYNGQPGVGVGAGSISAFTVGTTVDVKNRCGGPSCGVVGAALYGGTLENNQTTHISPPSTHNYALGDMLIQGSAIGGAISGLTRANAQTTGPTNSGGSNATILNSASLESTFTVGSTFSAVVAVTADSFLNVWVGNLASGETGQASAGQSWVLTIRCTQTASNDCGVGWSTLSFLPDELNLTATSTQPSENFSQSTGGPTTLYSAARTFIGGTTYQLTINQSSNANVSSVPEPSSIALLGAALLGAAGAATRRRRSK